jgi:hypothetical protein
MRVYLTITHDIPDNVVQECDDRLASTVYEELVRAVTVEGITGYSEIMEEIEQEVWGIINSEKRFFEVFSPLVSYVEKTFPCADLSKLHEGVVDIAESRYYDHIEDVSAVWKVTQRLRDLAIERRRSLLIERKKQDELGGQTNAEPTQPQAQV